MLLSLLVCRIANAAMCLGSSQPTQQKTMEGHLEKHDHRQAIATFVIIIGNRNNIATKKKMKVASHRFMYTGL